MTTFTQQIPGAIRGRGARTNATGRFESQVREAFDDGWTPDDVEPVQLTTTVSPEKAKVIITHNDSPDVGFSASINPYRGCEHGCIYCYARPAHAYMGLSPGLDFESKLFFKPEAARLLERELSKRSYLPEVIHIGGNTDPYQPQERRLRITRQVIEVLSRFNHPFTVISKSALILRDLDLLRQAASVTRVGLSMSIGFVDESLWRSVEPGTPSPRRRLDAVRALTDAGFPVSVLMAPILPGLTDDDASIDATVAAIAASGAVSATPLPLHLRPGAREWYLTWLGRTRPDLVPRYRELFRGGAYSPAAYQREVTGRVREAARRHGIGAAERAEARRVGPPDASPDPPPPPPEQLTLL